jgi:hypothetical protein
MSVQEFDAVLMQDDKTTGIMFAVPFNVPEVFGSKAQVKVAGTVDGVAYRSSIVPYGGVHYIGINKTLLKSVGKAKGDTVHVVMQIDTEERTVSTPDDLAQALETDEQAKARFDKLSYSHRKEYVEWIESAKKPETRANRVQKTLAMLNEGRKGLNAR